MSISVSLAWQDGPKRERMVAANQRKSADPAYRKRMSKAQRLCLQDPVKRRNRVEAVRPARRRERGDLAKFAQMEQRGEPGAPRKDDVATRLIELLREHKWAYAVPQLNRERFGNDTTKYKTEGAYLRLLSRFRRRYPDLPART